MNNSFAIYREWGLDPENNCCVLKWSYYDAKTQRLSFSLSRLFLFLAKPRGAIVERIKQLGGGTENVLTGVNRFAHRHWIPVKDIDMPPLEIMLPEERIQALSNIYEQNFLDPPDPAPIRTKRPAAFQLELAAKALFDSMKADALKWTDLRETERDVWRRQARIAVTAYINGIPV
jgi:hypothetical protein